VPAIRTVPVAFAVRAGLLATAVLFGAAAAAQQADDVLLSEDAFLDDVPVVLSATRLSQSVADAPVATTIIDRQMIEASGFTEIPDLLRLAPGFIVNYENGHTQAVGYHMLNDRFSRRMQVLIDGRSVYTPAVGGVPWTDLPLTIDNIERIEVIRGPNAVTYGSNSFMAVINIITRPAALAQGTRARVNAGGNGLAEGFVHHGGNQGRLDYRATVGYRQDDGFDERFDAKRVRIATLRGDYSPGSDDNLSLQLGFNKTTRGEDGIFDDYIPNHSATSYTQFQQLTWEHALGGAGELRLQLYHNLTKDLNTYTSEPIGALGGMRLPFDERSDAERYDFELQHTVSPQHSLRLVWGLGARRDEVTAPLFFNTDNTRNNRVQRLFVNGEYSLDDKTLINAGVMYEHNDISGSHTSPRLAVNHHFSRAHTLRLSASRAYRMPVLFEDMPDYRFPVAIPNNAVLVDNGELDAEQMTAWEIGYLGSFPEHGLSLDAKLYYNDIDDLISLDSRADASGLTGTVLFFDNLDDVTIKGIELAARYRYARHGRLQLGYTHQDLFGTDRSIYGTYSIAGPSDMLKLFLMHDFRGLDASVGYYYLSNVKEFSTSSDRPDQHRVDVRLARSWKRAHSRTTLALVVQNLFDANQDTELRNNIDRRIHASFAFSYE